MATQASPPLGKGRSGRRVLCFVEDPGAANYIAELPAALARRGIDCLLLAAGVARPYLADKGIPTIDAGDDDADSLLASTGPALVVVGTSENPETIGLRLVAAARNHGIESIGVVDTAANTDARFRGLGATPLAFAPDWIVVPDSATGTAYGSLGYPVGRMVTCGHPHYDAVRRAAKALAAVDRRERRRILFPDCPDDRQVIVFGTELSVAIAGRPLGRDSAYTLTGRGGRSDRTGIVIEETLDALEALPDKSHVVLRLHPKNDPDEYPEFRHRIQQVSRDGDALPLIDAADTVIGLTSTLLTEAVLLDRPTLSVLPRAAEREWLVTAVLGLTPVVTTRSALRAKLPTVLAGATRPPRGVVDEALPGGALDRLADFLLDRLAKH